MNHSTTATGPQAALDIIREKLFGGWPQQCRILEGRTRHSKNKVRTRDRGGIVRIPFPDKLIGNPHQAAIHIVHVLLDVEHPPYDGAEGKHTHNERWEERAASIGLHANRPRPVIAAHFDVVPGLPLDKLMPELMASLDNGETVTMADDRNGIHVYHECELCGGVELIRNPGSYAILKLSGCCSVCKFHMDLDHVRSLPTNDDTGIHAGFPELIESSV